MCLLEIFDNTWPGGCIQQGVWGERVGVGNFGLSLNVSVCLQ